MSVRSHSEHLYCPPPLPALHGVLWVLPLDTYGSLSGYTTSRGVCSYRTVHSAIISVTNRRSLSSALLISSSNEHQATFPSNFISAVSLYRHTRDPRSVLTCDDVMRSRIFSVRQINPFRVWLTRLQRWRHCQH